MQVFLWLFCVLFPPHHFFRGGKFSCSEFSKLIKNYTKIGIKTFEHATTTFLNNFCPFEQAPIVFSHAVVPFDEKNGKSCKKQKRSKGTIPKPYSFWNFCAFNEFWKVFECVLMHLYWRYTHLKNISFTHIQRYRSTHPRPRIFDLLTFLHIGMNSTWCLSTFCCTTVMFSSRIPPSIQKWNVRFSRSQKRSRMAAKVQDIILVVVCNALFHHCWITFYAYRKWCLIRVPIKPNTFFHAAVKPLKEICFARTKRCHNCLLFKEYTAHMMHRSISLKSVHQ